MAFASGADNIDIVVRVDAQGAVQTLQQVDGQLTELSTNAETASKSTSGLEVSFKTLAIAGAAAASAGAGLIAAISRGSDVDDVASAFERLSNAAGTTADTFQGELNEALGGTVSSFDLMRQANEQLRAGLSPDAILQVADAARVLADETGGNAAQEIEALSRALLTGNDRALKARGVIIDTKAAYDQFATSIGTTADKLNEAGQIEAKRIAILEALNQKVQESGKVSNDAADNIKALGVTLQNFADEAFQALATNDALNGVIAELTGLLKRVDFKPIISGIGAATKAFIGFGTAMGEAVLQIKQRFGEIANSGVIEEIDKSMLRLVDTLSRDTPEAAREAIKHFNLLAEEIRKSPTLVQRFNKEMQGLQLQVEDLAKSHGLLTAEVEKTSEATVDGSPKVESFAEKVQQAASAAEKYITDVTAASKGTELLAKEAEKAAPAVDKVGESLAQVQIIAAKRLSSPSSGGFFSDLFSGISGDSSGAGGIGKSIGDSIAQGISEALSAALSGSQGGIKDALKGLGSSALSSIGQAYGGPIGGAIGSVIGEKLGKGIFDAFDHVFGGRDAQGKIRDTLDRFFADALKDNPALVIIEDQLKAITDLEFLRDTDAFETGAFDDLLQSLPQSAQAAFEGMGIAFSSFVDGAIGQSSQLAAILANNLGGNLNNLQLLVQATGISFEQLASQVEQSFLRGEISAAQAFGALQQIQEISEKGIPGALGAVDQAFNNLKAAGVKGGAALVDALRDVGSEARELGIKDLAGVQAHLASTGQFSAEEIQKVFDALAAAGIDSIDELENATTQQLLPALAQLENAEFPFREAVADVEELIEKVDELPNNVTKKVRVEVEYVATGDEQAKQDASTGNTEGG